MSESTNDSAEPTAAPTSEATERPATLLTPAPASEVVDEKAEPKGEDESQDKADEDAKPEGAPEQYADFIAPEGVELLAPVVEAAKEVFKEVNLSQEAAQKVLDKLAPIVAKEQAEMLDAQITQQAADWEAEVRADKDIGGDKLPEVLANGQRVLEAFDTTGELSEMLAVSGLGNNPAIIKFMNNVYAKISPDTFVKGEAPKDKKPMYPNSNMVR
jgi:ribosome maturation factor RimP